MKEKYKLSIRSKKLLADTVTPVGMYLKLRDKFPNSILLESSDYHGNENSYSFICCYPLASISLENQQIFQKFPDGSREVLQVGKDIDLPEILSQFRNRFETPDSFIANGLFGYMSYDTVQYFEDIQFSSKENAAIQIPVLHYALYKYVLVINHFKNELFIYEYSVEENDSDSGGISQIESLIQNKSLPEYKFSLSGGESSVFSDAQFLEILKKGKEHVLRGDVFQIVLSRRFSQYFQGDEFNVYRALRSINPSPYLFYFDYGNFKIFGSSPEAQITISGGKASIHPIAGTFLRTGDDNADSALAIQLKNDPKEKSEHVMLVDLARNDLSRNGENVTVEVFEEIQFYSHIIHLVSKVTANLSPKTNTLKVVADTFPAGTLSGAPKYKAMQLIDQYEKLARTYYGGCIGFMGFNGDFNHAIMIRSFLSQNNQLFYQAGAGVVAASKLENELLEVNNKLMALKTALEMAGDI